jgi:hypothetical protein
VRVQGSGFRVQESKQRIQYPIANNQCPILKGTETDDYEDEHENEHENGRSGDDTVDVVSVAEGGGGEGV